MDVRKHLTIARHRVVGLRYNMRNRHGEILENRMSGDPAVYLQGSDAILPSLQAQLEGLQPGDQKKVTLRLEPGDGLPDYLFEVEILSVRTATTAELSLGYPLPVAEACGSDCDCHSRQQVAGIDEIPIQFE